MYGKSAPQIDIYTQNNTLPQTGFFIVWVWLLVMITSNEQLDKQRVDAFLDLVWLYNKNYALNLVKIWHLKIDFMGLFSSYNFISSSISYYQLVVVPYMGRSASL